MQVSRSRVTISGTPNVRPTPVSPSFTIAHYGPCASGKDGVLLAVPVMRCVSFCVLAFVGGLTPALAETATLEAVTVVIDHAKVLRLPERTQTVIVGNPIIADVSVQKNGVLVLTGKSYGRTNLIALDGTGSLLAESMISVQAPNDAVVTVQRGLDRESYSCTPHCQPSILLGDAGKHFSETSGQAGQRAGLAAPK